MFQNQTFNILNISKNIPYKSVYLFYLTIRIYQ
jgi:hypothetical protein